MTRAFLAMFLGAEIFTAALMGAVSAPWWDGLAAGAGVALLFIGLSTHGVGALRKDPR